MATTTEKYYLGAPLTVFEVVSESQTAAQLDGKIAEYLANGTAEVWMFYSPHQHAWVYTPGGTARQEARSIHSDLLPGMEIPFSAIF